MQEIFMVKSLKMRCGGKPPFPTPKKEFNEEILIQIKEDIKNKLK